MAFRSAARLARPLLQRSAALSVQAGAAAASPAATAARRRSTRILAAGAAGIGIAALAGAGALAVHGASKVMIGDPRAVYSEQTRARIRDTFLAVGEAIAISSASAVLAFRSPAVQRFLMNGVAMPMIVGLVGMGGTMMLTYAMPMQPVLPKHLAFAAFAATTGLFVSPLVAAGGTILLRAAVLTAASVGSLCVIAANSPSTTFLSMAGPLSMGLGVVVASSLGAAFFPGFAAAPLLYNISLYGGLALFSGFVLYDTSRIVAKAESTPGSMYDPINECLSLYMDVVNIFIRLVTILSSGGNRRR